MISSFATLPAAERRPVPWKNGTGVTAEIDVSPKGAGLDDFDWRLSIAEVASDGPFSLFPQIDRTLTLLRGTGISLDLDGASHSLTQQSAPFSFPGDLPCQGRLLQGPITDLNVMTRRGRFRHRVAQLSAEGDIHWQAEAGITFLLWITGSAEISAPGGAARPAPLDALRCDRPGSWRIRNDGRDAPWQALWITLAALPSPV